MARQNIPNQPKVNTIAYDGLLGVDYQSDATEVSRRRSPEMVNMISDKGGIPVKRYGYRNLLSADTFTILEMGNATYAIQKFRWSVQYADSAIRIYAVTFGSDGRATQTLLKEIAFPYKAAGEPTYAFASNGYIYLFLEKAWCKYDAEGGVGGEVAIVGLYEDGLYEQVDEDQYSHPIYDLILKNEDIIPTTYTMLKPNGMEMVSIPADMDITGATKGVNLLTPFVKAEYCVQADTVTETDFLLPTRFVNTVMSGAIKVEILTGGGHWETLEMGNHYNITLHGGVATVLPDATSVSGRGVFNTYIARVVFSTAPFKTTPTGITNNIGTSSTRDVPTNEPNIRITYAECIRERLPVVWAGYWRKERTLAFSSGSIMVYDGRLFVASGDRVYYSRAGEYFVIDDNYYIDMDSTVTGFLKTSNGLGVICEGSHPIYILSGEYSETLAMPVYTAKASNANIEPVISTVDGAFNDEPIVITRGGIYGITTNYHSDKYSIKRSGKIDKRLCAEPDLGSAVGIVFDGYLWVAVGTKMYVLDGRHKDASRNGDNSYECYYFEGLPAITNMWQANGRMYFSNGTNTYVWNDDLDGELQYIDGLLWNVSYGRWMGGNPVKASWKSVLDGDGAPQYYKTLQKKGTMVTLAPPMQTSCQITLIRDAHDKIYAGRFNGSTFSLSDAALDAFTKKKVKKYKRLQFVVENNEPEPFGIISIVKSFVLNNYAKR